MGFWRWTLVDNRRPVCRMESGQRQDLRLAMEDVAKTVEYMLECDGDTIASVTQKV